MQNHILTLLFILCSFYCEGQNTGIGTTNPHPSAALEITGTSRGILIPRMTMSQRNAIQNPAEGLMVYQTDSAKGIWLYETNQWHNITQRDTKKVITLENTLEEGLYST